MAEGLFECHYALDHHPDTLVHICVAVEEFPVLSQSLLVGCEISCLLVMTPFQKYS